MEKETVERITFQITNLTELTHGYILNCRCEGKSPTTISTYEEHLKRFLWYCQQLPSASCVLVGKYLYSSLVMVQNYLQSLNVKDAAKAYQRFSPIAIMNLKV